MWLLIGLIPKFPFYKPILLLIFIIGIVATSAYQKYTVNTALWPPGAFWTSSDEIATYIWLRNSVQPNANVFTFVSNGPVLGMDKFICHWCQDIRDYQKNGFNQSADSTYRWLKKESYKYFIIDGGTVRKFGINETNRKVQELINYQKFKSIFNNNGAIIFEVI